MPATFKPGFNCPRTAAAASPSPGLPPRKKMEAPAFAAAARQTRCQSCPGHPLRQRSSLYPAGPDQRHSVRDLQSCLIDGAQQLRPFADDSKVIDIWGNDPASDSIANARNYLGYHLLFGDAVNSDTHQLNFHGRTRKFRLRSRQPRNQTERPAAGHESPSAARLPDRLEDWEQSWRTPLSIWTRSDGMIGFGSSRSRTKRG